MSASVYRGLRGCNEVILRTGSPWVDLPERYRPYQTCHRRFQQWVRSGIMRGVLEALAEDLRSRGGFDLEEAFIEEKEPKSWPLQTAMVFRSRFAQKAPHHMK